MESNQLHIDISQLENFAEHTEISKETLITRIAGNVSLSLFHFIKEYIKIPAHRTK